MMLISGMLLGICLLYGLLIAWLFNNGMNFNQIWIWSTFILFTINHMTLTGGIKLNFYVEEDKEDE